jgi:predicted porin
MAAIPLSKGMSARLVVVVAQVVPYPLPVDQPPEATEFIHRRFQSLVQELDGDAEIVVYLCRTPNDVVQAIPLDSTVVVGGRNGSVWLTREERLSRRLIRLGHHVVFAAGGGPRARFVAAVVAALMITVPRLATAQAPGEISADPPTASAAAPDDDDQNGGLIDFVRDMKIGVGLDTYYGWNFNRPIGRVNLLRAYDVTSNSFSLNQVSLILERPVDLDAGRRFGARLDLQYGQATETLQGSLANEPRPQVYRPIFQAYGTYVFPVAAGFTVDFGKWASAIGYENNYTKDQINYSRSFWFNFLPFYHMGARVNMKFNDAISANYWITNGTQQTEAFNNFKDQMFGVFLQRHDKSVSLTFNYYLGQEHPDVQPIQTIGVPSPGTQPGISVTPVDPAPDGRLHIYDTYLSWQASPKMLFGFEADYIVSRLWEHDAPGQSAKPSHVSGGAGYARRQVTPGTSIAVRAEYLRDRDALFSGGAQSLKETTVTYEYRIEKGVLVRVEWRGDFSDRPFFLTDTVGRLKSDQQTLTAGLIWWWGNKTGTW